MAGNILHNLISYVHDVLEVISFITTSEVMEFALGMAATSHISWKLGVWPWWDQETKVSKKPQYVCVRK